MRDIMGLSSVAGFPVSLDAKRRPTLPAELLRDAHIQAGDELRAFPGGEGIIVLCNRDAVLSQVRESIRAGFDAPVTEGAVERFLAERRQDQTREDARFASRNDDTTDEQTEARGAALIAELGL